MNTTNANIQTAMDIVDDPHEFATAYVNHVENTGERVDVVAAAYQFKRTGRI